MLKRSLSIHTLMLRRSFYILLAVVFIDAASVQAVSDLDEREMQELKVKVAFIYNFFSFIDWPPEKNSENDESVAIGVVGEIAPEAYKTAFEPLTQKQVNGKKIVVIRFADLGALTEAGEDNTVERKEIIEAMKRCHLLMFCKSPEGTTEKIPAILSALKGAPILTVGETPGFADKGGTINFVTVKQKIRFEINLVAARENQLTLRSRLLKLAERVIEN